MSQPYHNAPQLASLPQEWEKAWWGNCQNTYTEESKQFLYAQKMGLLRLGSELFCGSTRTVLDVGGGPVSLLLKCRHVQGKVVDPCEYPDWTASRYHAAGIKLQRKRGEDMEESGYDEVWIYNVLQHVEDPGKVLANARRAGEVLRIFEWIDTGVTEGHPNCLTEDWLNQQIGTKGTTEVLNGENGCYGRCYYGAFKENNS